LKKELEKKGKKSRRVELCKQGGRVGPRKKGVGWESTGGKGKVRGVLWTWVKTGA